MRQFRGPDELNAAFNGVALALVATIALAAAFSGSAAGWAVWLTLLPVTAVICLGTRYRLRVHPHGVELTRYLGFVPYRSKTYFLDVIPELYECWESDVPQGVYLRNAAIYEDDSDVFGPAWSVDEMARLCEEIAAAVDLARGSARSARDPRLHGVPPDALEVHRRSPGGVPREVRTRRAIAWRGLEIPAGSVIELNRDGWVDPRRQDVVQSITVSRATLLTDDVVLPAGGRIWGGDPSRISCTGFASPLLLDHIPISGQHEVVLNKELAPVGYTLDESHRFGGLRIPAGSRLSDGYGLGRCFLLGGPLRLPDLTLHAGESLYFDDNWGPTYISTNEERAIGGRTYSAGLLHLRHDLRLDVRKCRQLGHVS